MNYSSNGLQLTEYFEGCSLTSYQDAAGVWTIGYGHTTGVQAGDICTQAQAEAWLEQDVAGAVATVNQFVTVPLTRASSTLSSISCLTWGRRTSSPRHC